MKYITIVRILPEDTIVFSKFQNKNCGKDFSLTWRREAHFKFPSFADVNERPIKMCLVGNTTILELQKPDQVIGQLLIEDPDHKESTGICTKRSPSLTYSQNYTCEIESNFIDVSSLKLDFYVDKKLKLHSNVTFNYAAKKQYIVPIICRDIHKPIHLIELTVTIKIKGKLLKCVYFLHDRLL